MGICVQYKSIILWNHGMRWEISTKRILRTRSTFSKSVTVSVGVSTIGIIQLKLSSHVRINGAYYRDVLVSQTLIGSVAGETSTLRQDNIHIPAEQYSASPSMRHSGVFSQHAPGWFHATVVMATQQSI